MSADKEIVNSISLWSIWQTGLLSIDVERIRDCIRDDHQAEAAILDSDGDTQVILMLCNGFTASMPTVCQSALACPAHGQAGYIAEVKSIPSLLIWTTFVYVSSGKWRI
jgi:hypothetical protein